MNLYLINVIIKWISVLFLSLTSFFGLYKEEKIVTENTNKNMSLNMTTEVISHTTEIKYNHEKPAGEKSIVVAGEDGYLVRNNENNAVKVMKNPVNEIVEIGTAKKTEDYIGKLTMYYNCPNRSVCKTSSGYNLKNTVFYDDATYGTIRIVSAATSKFTHGTIIEISGANIDPFHAIVLDTGGDMNAAWKKGSVHMDLAIDASTEKATTFQGVKFEVKRWGY